MINARINDGDIVFIRKQDIVNNGEIAVVIIDDSATLKRFYYYKEKNKGSFGMINSITTVSKYRINKPLNELDPIGHIRVSDEIMNRIDREIIKSYTSIDLTQENG